LEGLQRRERRRFVLLLGNGVLVFEDEIDDSGEDAKLFIADEVHE
jgi:hypothetical protein